MEDSAEENYGKQVDIQATLEKLISQGRLEECFANLVGVVIHVNGVCELLKGLKTDGVLFPDSPDEFQDEFEDLITSMQTLIDDGIFPDLVQIDVDDDKPI